MDGVGLLNKGNLVFNVIGGFIEVISLISFFFIFYKLLDFIILFNFYFN